MEETNVDAKVKCHFTLSAEAVAIIEKRAASANKRGDWISAALVDYDRILSGVPVTVESCGTLEGLGERLAGIERMIAALRVV